MQSLPSPTDTIACLVEMTGVAKKVMLALQKTSSFKFEIDFFGKDLIEDIVEKLVHHWQVPSLNNNDVDRHTFKN